MKQNLLNSIPDSLYAELETVLVEKQNVRIERIISTGHASPEGFWYDQEEHEWVIVLKGAATLLFEAGESVKLTPGDYLLIASHKKHRVEWTTPEEPTVWLAVFFRD